LVFEKDEEEYEGGEFVEECIKLKTTLHEYFRNKMHVFPKGRPFWMNSSVYLFAHFLLIGWLLRAAVQRKKQVCNYFLRKVVMK